MSPNFAESMYTSFGWGDCPPSLQYLRSVRKAGPSYRSIAGSKRRVFRLVAEHASRSTREVDDFNLLPLVVASRRARFEDTYSL